MDCSFCSSVPHVPRTPRNVICLSCFEGARRLVTFAANTLEPVDSSVQQSSLSKGFASALKKIKELKEREESLKEKLGYIGELIVVVREGIHTDIQVKPGIGPSVPAHRAILAAKSDIFKNMLESDMCKAPPNDIISLPELNHEELHTLLEFLYTGTLPSEKVVTHVYSLYAAADKYEIPFLQNFCEGWMLGSLNTSNVLDVLEVSDVCLNSKLKDCAMKFIVDHMEDVLFSAKYDAFSLKNPHVNVQVTRAVVMDVKNRYIIDDPN
ncbi:hypothetical protein Syun_000125 [Stephania yunnanensis]|uniref:BTB domain-containing protein n=1 Tax=Stephania yunnanensis TaxID=152371 RepID=A0AAP0LE60_9MAGN